MSPPLIGRPLRIEDEGYPAVLRRLSDAPEVLFVDGALDGLDRAVGIVGTRRATPAALALTREMARALAELGVVIVSGGAEGIDAAAHEGALDARSGRTIAVLPTALARPFPVRHAELFERISKRGARLTEHSDPKRVLAAHFLQRNRIIAALSRAVVVIQAPSRSGALRTAVDAKALGLPVLAMPWSPNEIKAQGGLELLVRGASVVRDANDVLAVLGESTPKKRARAQQMSLVDPDQAAVLAAIEETAIDRETLLARVTLPIARAQAALMELVIDGRVHEDAHGVRRA